MRQILNILKEPKVRVIGLMSGTSADGIDAVLVEINKKNLKVKELLFRTFPYPEKLKQKILQVSSASNPNLDEVCHLNFVLGEYFSAAALKLLKGSKYKIGNVDLIGSHGQTIRHLPKPTKSFGKKIRATFQIAEPSIIAKRTKVATVADFRPADIAVGGEGAPLVPYPHFLLFGGDKKGTAILNIGGIANITVWSKNSSQIMAFDTGPGNMLLDFLMKKLFQKDLDRNGRIALSGEINLVLLKWFLKHPYFSKRPPKSSGRAEFGEKFARKFLSQAQKLKVNQTDIITTAGELTVQAVFLAYLKFIQPKFKVEKFLLTGGGEKNLYFKKRLKEMLKPTEVESVNIKGSNPDSLEAVSFAILGYLTILGRPGNLASATGGKPTLLGKICLP